MDVLALWSVCFIIRWQFAMRSVYFILSQFVVRISWGTELRYRIFHQSICRHFSQLILVLLIYESYFSGHLYCNAAVLVVILEEMLSKCVFLFSSLFNHSHMTGPEPLNFCNVVFAFSPLPSFFLLKRRFFTLILSNVHTLQSYSSDTSRWRRDGFRRFDRDERTE